MATDYIDINDPIYNDLNERVHCIINSMSLKEKVHELHGRGIIKMGLSVMLFRKIIPVRAGGNQKRQIPATIFLDGPRGVSFYKGATAFPVTMARGASWDIDLERRIGEAMAEEIKSLGSNYSGAVCMNLLRHPRWGRAQETYGEDPWHVGEMAAALVKGIQSKNVQACSKHFAANSMENNRFGGSMNMNARTLQEVYLPHFKKVVQTGVASIMSAYNKLNGEYCGHHRELLTDILRNDWGFKGYVTSDWEAGLLDTLKGIDAGMNVEMPKANFYSLKNIQRLLDQQKISEHQIDELLFPILRTKLLFQSSTPIDKKIVGCQAHVSLALEAAEKSAVLLKNDHGFLPLNKKKINKIAVIGSLADVKQTGDHGSSNVFPSYIVSPLEGLENYLNNTAIEIVTANVSDLDAIKKICKDADAVIVIAGTSYKDEGEYIGDWKMRDKDDPDKKNFVVRLGFLALGGDRKYLHLHQDDIDVIDAVSSINAHVVISLVAGSAITVEEWYDRVPAILQTFYNGMEGGTALAKILFGDVNPSGKLPFTVPFLENDLPPFHSFDAAVEYGYYHGYTLLDKQNKEARFPFGFGLSYTKFELSSLILGDIMLSSNDMLDISVLLKNTGMTAGEEVVQIYIGFTESKIDRPVKILRAFKKVRLFPGEEDRIFFKIAVADLAYYCEDEKKWKIEHMKYEVFAGNSSCDPKMLQAEFEVK